VLSVSPDGRWLLIASPTASGIPSGFKGQYSTSAEYNTNDTVIYTGKLWKANKPILGDGSTINLSSEDWSPVDLHEAQPAAKNLIGTNPGYPKQGCVDIFEFTQGQWTYRKTIISPRPEANELFGSSVSIGKQEGIEGTSGDVTLIVKAIDTNGGITIVDAVGTSGLKDATYQNIGGTDISDSGNGASFNITKSGGTYVATVRNGGTRYALGDQINVLGTQLGGSSPENDLLITVTAIDTGGSIIGSETYSNLTGINSTIPTNQAVFNVTRTRSTYSVAVIDRGVGYTGRSIVSYSAPGIGLRYYGCIKDTQTDRGVWDSNATYYTGDVVKYPFRSSSYYRVKNGLDGSIQEVQFVLPTDTDYWEVSDPILPTNREYWEEVSAGTFSSLATTWKAYVTATSEGNLGDLIKYRSGSTILIPGTTLGGDSPANDLLIRVSPNLPITTVGTFETNSTVIVGSTSTLRVDMPIVFTGSAVGGISSGSQYFVKEIINNSSFTIYSDPLTKQIVSLTSSSSPTANPMKFTDNSIRNFTISGVAKSGISFSGVSAGLGSYSDIIGTDISESGSGAIFELVRSNGRYFATVNVRGTRYNVGDQIRILGSNIGGASEAYYMAISAPGALDNKGRIYLYSFDGIDWKQSDDNNFVGIFNPALDYATGSIVWYNNNYWRSTVPYFKNSGTTITTETIGWELVDSLNAGILPIQPAYPNDGSSIEVGLVGDQTPELLNVGDRYGYSTTMSLDASLLVVGAPFADTADLENYKGTWKSYQEYNRDDVVKIVELGQPTYYKLLAVESLNQIPVSGAVWEKVSNASEYNTGAVFVYLKNQENIYELVQTIDDNDIISDDLESGDELGFKVVLSREGNLLFVSAPDADIKEKDKGAVFVFKNVNNRFEYIQRLESYSFDFFERFGDEISVSPTADTIAITAGSAVASTLINFDRGETNFDYLLTRFRDPVGITGKVYIYNRYGDTFILSESFDEGLITGESFGKSLACFDDRVIIGSPTFKSSEDAFLGSIIGKVQTFRKYKNINAWSPLRSQEPAVDLTLLKSLSMFDSNSNIKLLDVDVIDPLNGKILSVAEQELKFKTSYDPAAYSVGTSADPSRAWFDNMVGYLWWDTSSVKWTNYNQGDISYKLGGWNSLAYGSSIDVYEWVETEYLPSEWADISITAEAFSLGVSGTPLYPDNSSYSVKENLDTLTGRVSSRLYYYWVKDKITLPTNKNFRKIAASSVAQYIQNPLGTGITFAALIDNEKIAIYNPTVAITGNNVSITIQFYKNSKQINQVHREYQLLTEGVADSLPSSDLENKWIDSLIGYDITGKDVPDFKLPTKFKYGLSSRPRQSMFVDRNKATQITLDFVNNILKTRPFAEIINTDRLNSFEVAPADVKNLYDRTVETKEELAIVSTSKISPAILKANIANGKIDTVDVIDPGYGYRVSPPIVVIGSGSGAVLRANVDRLGRVTSVTVVKPGERYLSATLSVRQFAVLVKTDSTVRNYWSIYSWNEKAKEFYRTATQSYDTRNYWTTADWWAAGFSEKSRITNEIVGLYQESEVNLTIGQLLRIREYGSGRWAVLERTSQENSTILDKYRLVGRSNGTIQINESFINTENNSTGYDKTTSFDSNGYDQSSAREFRIILESIKNDIFVDDLRVEWNKLFFANIHYAFSEQLYVDWAFKTSFVNATHNVGNLTQKITYKSDNLPSYQKYIEEVKPYRTKIREYTSRYIRTENTSTSFSDFDVPSVYNPDTNSIEPVKIISTEIDTYPWKYWLDNYKYSVTDIQISNVGSGYKTVPIVVFEGGGGTGASARAFISNGKVSRIVLTDSGTGYTSAPTVKIVGGVGTNLSNSATAVAIIGNSKARTFDLSMKFDRVSKTSTFTAKALDEKFKEIQTFTGTGSKTVFELKYPAALDKTKVNVYTKLVSDQTASPGQKLLTGQYSLSIDTNIVNGLTIQIGKLTLNSAPAKNILVTVEYEKNDQSLDSLNRIDKYYKPKDGMIGLEKTIIRDDITQEIIKVDYDYSQLMTGIDFGGVVVQGATLDVSGGWDALPWFTEGWDSVDSLNSDFYITADGTTNTFVLPEVPVDGQAINIYLRNSVTGIYERIDYLNYSSVTDVPLETAVMDTFIGDGSTQSIVIPPEVTIQDGDVLIFRPDISDGSLTITDPNLIDADVSGGLLSSNTTGRLVAPNAINGAYSTATGLTAAEIIIEGDKFVSPDQVPAPEENIPGQVLESVSIKVFHSDRQGAPAILSRIYNADGTTILYDIGQTILENSSVIVFVDKVKQEVDVDYTFESDTQQIRFLTAPTNNSLIEIFSISIGGVEILDYREFVGDGSNRYFLTAASYAEAGRVFATVDYSSTPVAFVNSNGVVNNVDKALVEFGIAPPNESKISIIVLSGESGTSNSIVRANYQTITVTNTSQRTYSVTDFIELQASATGNVIVELNDKLLRCADTVIQTYNGTNRVVNVGRDPLRPFGGIVQAQVRAYINNIPLVFGIEYEFSAATNSVNVIKQNINHGDVIRVETYENVQYEIIDNNLVLSTNVILTLGDKINIIWFDRYSSVDLVKDIRTGGQLNYPLQRAPLGVSYVWVYKNGDRLTPDVDFYIDYPRNTVYLKDSNTEDDEIELISFATEVYKQPFAFEIFKDILNSHHYNRYTVTDVKLTKELNYYDNELEVNDATTLSTPQLKLPGIVTINGERIEYLQKVGNLLKDLRRGTLGTSIANTHPIDSYVVDVGYQEIVPYKESQDRYDFVADGSSEIYTGLPFVPPARKNQQGTLVEFTYASTIPDNFYPCDTIEVFVQGRRLRKDPITVYDSTVGSHSPAGDVTIEAEFSVDNQTNSIRITQTPPAGARITVIKRTGKVWYNQGADEVTSGVTLSQNTTPIAKFLQQRTTKLL
jgi:hypothetical protein